MSRLVDLQDVVKIYAIGEGIEVKALRGINLQVEKGETLSIMGPSGSGKSTLLNMIGGLDNPTSGQVIIDGIDITYKGEGELARFRREKIGFVFQFFNLVPILTALENVELPMLFSGKLSPREMTERATDLLKLVGLDERLHHRPSQLSGGEQQRVALARALANEPAIVMADEPTGNVDRETGLKMIRFIQHLNKILNQTFILVTHDPDVARKTQRTLYMSDGNIMSKLPKISKTPPRHVLLKERRELILAELGWLRNSITRHEEIREEMNPDLYDQFIIEYENRLGRLKQSVKELDI